MAQTHGKSSTYKHASCRCVPCRAAHTAEMNEQRDSRLARPEDIPHGPSGYKNWSCRCDICCAANTESGQGDWDTSRTGQRWTADDLLLATSEELSVGVAAMRMRRSYRSVVMKRFALRRSA